MFCSFHPLADETNNKHLRKPFFKVIRKSLYSPQGTFSLPISYPVLHKLTIRGENCVLDLSLSSLSHLVFISHWLNKEVQNKKAGFLEISRLKRKDNRLGIKLLVVLSLINTLI